MAITAVRNYLDRMARLFDRAKGPNNHALFVDNNAGRFTFQSEPLVNELTIVNTDEELAYVKGTLQSNAFIFNSWKRISRGVWPDHEQTVALGFSDTAMPSELEGWSYDPVTDKLVNTLDTWSMVGFVSPDVDDHYVFDTTLKSSSDWQNDPLGVLVGYARDPDGTTHTLTVFRTLYHSLGHTLGDLNSALQVTVDYNTVGRVDIASKNEGLFWVDGSPATGPTPTQGPNGEHVYAIKPWASAPNGIQLKVTRTGDHFRIETSNYDVPGLVPEATIEFTLNDHPSLARFKGPQPYGYVAVSQDMANWTSTQRPGNPQTVLDARTLTKHEFVDNSWTTTPTTMGELVSPGRLYFGTGNRKLWLCTAAGTFSQVTTSLGG